MNLSNRLLVICAVLAPSVFGQGGAAPPPEIDKALRDRAAQFLRFNVDHTYSKAYTLVAEDTRDWYLSSGKPQYTKFEIQDVEYADGFKKATVKAKVSRVLSMSGRDISTELVVSDLWRIEDGKWMWYHDTDVIETPFGPVKVDRTLPPAGTRTAEVPKDLTPDATSKAAGNLRMDAFTDKQELFFDEGHPGDQELVFHNGLKGIVRIEADIVGDYRAYSVEPSDVQVLPGADLKLHVHYKPIANAVETSVRLLIDPFNRTLLVPVKYKNTPASSR